MLKKLNKLPEVLTYILICFQITESATDFTHTIEKIYLCIYKYIAVILVLPVSTHRAWQHL